MGGRSSLYVMCLTILAITYIAVVAMLICYVIFRDNLFKRFILFIVFVVWLTNKKRLALFPLMIIVKDPHNCESLTCHK